MRDAYAAIGKKMKNSNPVLLVNLLWTIGCLLICLIISVSVGWSKVPELVNIISVALSLSSLLLAIIAIVQSLISNDGLSGSISDIGRAANNILSTSSDLDKTMELFNSKVEQIYTMPKTLEDVKTTLNAMSLKTNPESTSINKPKHEIIQRIDDIETIYKDGTKGGTMALYAALKSFETGKKFEYTDIFDDSIGMYGDGYLGALKSSGILRASRDDDGKFSIDDIQPFSAEIIKSWVKRLTEDDEKGNKHFIENVKKIDLYFNR